ncbi:hypothetical protein VTO73DRAFT_6279 [Trametes versicolor]
MTPPSLRAIATLTTDTAVSAIVCHRTTAQPHPQVLVASASPFRTGRRRGSCSVCLEDCHSGYVNIASSIYYPSPKAQQS